MTREIMSALPCFMRVKQPHTENSLMITLYFLAYGKYLEVTVPLTLTASQLNCLCFCEKNMPARSLVLFCTLDTDCNINHNALPAREHDNAKDFCLRKRVRKIAKTWLCSFPRVRNTKTTQSYWAANLHTTVSMVPFGWGFENKE